MRSAIERIWRWLTVKSNVNILDHPLHPILVLIPAGAWITSLVFDIIFLATGSSFWFVASLWIMVVGIGGAVLAAITGAYDLFTLPMAERPKKTGLTHMTLNLIITVLYIINVAAIRAPVMNSAIRAAAIPSNTVAWGFILNVVAVLLLLESGWLGGELIYRYGIAIPRETMENAPRFETRQAPGRGTAGALGGESDQPD